MVQNADNSLVRNNLHPNAGINTVFSIEALSLFSSVFFTSLSPRYFFCMFLYGSVVVTTKMNKMFSWVWGNIFPCR